MAYKVFDTIPVLERKGILSTQDSYIHPYDHLLSTGVPLWETIVQYWIPLQYELFCY